MVDFVCGMGLGWRPTDKPESWGVFQEVGVAQASQEKQGRGPGLAENGRGAVTPQPQLPVFGTQGNSG